MISTIVGSIDNRINHLLFMTTGGHIPHILHQSPAAAFVRRMFDKGFETKFNLKDTEILYDIYNEELPKVKQMSFNDIISNEQIHPLFKVDPISYAHLLDMKKLLL